MDLYIVRHAVAHKRDAGCWQGGVVRLSCDGPPEAGAGYLEWLLAPKALRAIG